MKKNGFTLIEFLISIAVLGLVLVIGLFATKDTVATSLTRFRVVNDNEIFSAAESYVIENNISLKKGYTCVNVSDLVDYGYLDDTNDEIVKNRIVKLVRNNITKTIEEIKYVEECD